MTKLSTNSSLTRTKTNLRLSYKTNIQNIQDSFSNYFILSTGKEVRDCVDLVPYPSLPNIQLIAFTLTQFVLWQQTMAFIQQKIISINTRNTYKKYL